MTPLIEKYPLDWTGTLPQNLIPGEEHVVPRVKNKCFALDGGPFFTETLKIHNKLTGALLVPGKDYKHIFLYQDATLYAGREVCAGVAIVNDAISGTLVCDYQIVGGPYVSLVDAIYQAIEQLALDDSSINWDDIKNKPELYPPEPHIHHVSALYGTEHVCQAIYSLKAAMLVGDGQAVDLIWGGVDELRKQMVAGDLANSTALNTHEQRKDNPHQVTKTHVQLGNVQNFGLATQAEAEAVTIADKYMTPQSVGWAIAKIAGGLLNSHVVDYNNPHRVTKAQVNLGLVMNYDIATKAEAEAGLAENKYMTPFRVAQAISVLVTPILNTHINNKNNPHEVTATQVGLGSVLNYGMATQAEAEAGTVANKYMSPQQTAQAITKQAIAPLNTHINNKANPHDTTKTQVGLSEVQNFGIASQAEAEAGLSESKYITPLRVAQAITKQAIAPLNTHIADKNNPHNTTKAQVGLNLVNNWGVADDTAARAALAKDLYITPFGVSLAAERISQEQLAVHASNKNNPHGVTKAQVGLPNVQNFNIATDVQAVGSGNDSYLTPFSGRKNTTAVIDERLYTSGAPTTSRLVTTGSDLLTRVGKSLVFNDATAERFRITWMDNTTGGGAGLVFNGAIDVGDIYVRSDLRAKQNVRYFKDNPERVTERLLSMAEHGLARYQYTESPDREQIGTIAQVIQEHFPELVRDNGSDNLGLSIPGYLAVLLAGFTEQQAEIEKMKRELFWKA